MKKLAICIPTYNRPDKLLRLLNQLLTKVGSAQKHKSLIELCISDNGSLIDITDTVKCMIAENADIAIKYFRFNENTGPVINFCNCVEMSDSEYCWIIGDDDLLIDDAELDTIIELLTMHEPAVMTFPFYADNLSGKMLLFPSDPSFPELSFNFRSNERDYETWFSNVHNSGGQAACVFGFISSVIFKRQDWMRHSSECDWDPTNLYYQCFIHLKTLLGGGDLYYYNIPLILRDATGDQEIPYKRPGYCYEALCSVKELIGYFFHDKLADALERNFLWIYYYYCIMESAKITESQKRHLRDVFNDEYVRFYEKIYLPADRYCELKDKNIVVFGTGEFSARIRMNFRRRNLGIVSLVDNNKAKQGLTIDGVEITDLGDSLNIPDSVYIIAIALHNDVETVYSQLVAAGIQESRIRYCLPVPKEYFQ